MSALHPTTPRFKANAREALANPNIQSAMGQMGGGFSVARAKARDAMPEFDALRDSAASCLAQVILFDQLPRNMYRDTSQRFASGARALAVAAHAIEQGFDDALADRRVFFYLPYMHSESLADQDRCIALLERGGANDNLFWARHHRAIIARFGRFPHRNATLGRESTAEEVAWLASDDAFHG